MAKNNIPNSWELKKFTDFCDLKHGFQFREEHFVEKGIPVIKIGNIIDGGGIREDNLTYVKPELVNQFDNFKLNEGDILMALTGGTLGKVCLFPKKENIYFQNYRVGNFIPLKNANREYILQLLQSYIIQERISNLVNEAAQPNFGKQDFDKILVSLPPLPEQKAIAHILGLMDEAINKNNQLIAQKEQRKKWLIQNLLTGKKRLKGFGGEWKEYKLREITKIYDGTHMTPDYVKNGIPFYSVEHLTSDNFSETKFISEEVYEKECERVQLKKGDILMTRIGDIGTSKYIDWDVKASFYVSLALIKNHDQNVDAQFLNQFIKSNFFQKELHQRTIHVAFPKKINLGEIGECLVLLPPLLEQTAIAQILQAADKEIQLLKTKTDKLKEQKKGMMQQLLTGKKRLKIN